jgi:hypothetical protein
MNCGCKLIVKNPFLHWSSRQNFNTNIEEVQAPNVVFWPLDDIELVDWTTTNKICKIMVLWGYPPLIYSQTGNQKSNSEISQLDFFKQVVWRWFKWWKNQFVGFVSSHKKGHTVDILPYSQLCCLPYWFAEEHNCDMHPYIKESHDVKYPGSITSAYAIDTILSCVLIFHHHHQ